MDKKKKTLIISYYFPPISVAASHVINSIVKFLPKEDVCVLRGNPDETYGALIIDNDFKLDVLQYISDIPKIFRKKSFKITLPVYLYHLWILAVILKGLKIIRKNKVENILTLFPNHYFLIASYFIHKISGLPLIIYWVDVYQEGRPHFFERWVAYLFEKKILVSARKNFVMTPFLKEHLRKKYGIETEVLPIPTELKPDNNVDSLIKNDKEIRIVFTGRIYDAQLDAVVNLVNALKLINQFNIKLLLITPERKETLEKQGISGENVSIFQVRRDECIAFQRQADILFLPLAFNSPSPLVVNLSLPSKVLEYFVAMRPILVHAPSDSYIVSYAKEKGFAVVVDKPDPDELKKAIIELINNKKQRDIVVRNALSMLLDHDGQKISKLIQDNLY
jgi:glycosyltransferase involved in cell wall biosynthesis